MNCPYGFKLIIVSGGFMAFAGRNNMFSIIQSINIPVMIPPAIIPVMILIIRHLSSSRCSRNDISFSLSIAAFLPVSFLNTENS